VEGDGRPEKPKRKDLIREKRILLTESEEEDIDLILTAISSKLGIRVKFSNVLRACLSLLFHVEPELRKQCKRYGKIGKRPSNNEPTEIATFEENLARIFDGAIRNTRSLDYNSYRANYTSIVNLHLSNNSRNTTWLQSVDSRQETRRQQLRP
jgi:hypothetical protein